MNRNLSYENFNCQRERIKNHDTQTDMGSVDDKKKILMTDRKTVENGKWKSVEAMNNRNTEVQTMGKAEIF